eukprot:scaffold25204_cov193-Amphora_coffeaeformis.AAC.4
MSFTFDTFHLSNRLVECRGREKHAAHVHGIRHIPVTDIFIKLNEDAIFIKTVGKDGTEVGHQTDAPTANGISKLFGKRVIDHVGGLGRVEFDSHLKTRKGGRGGGSYRHIGGGRRQCHRRIITASHSHHGAHNDTPDHQQDCEHAIAATTVATTAVGRAVFCLVSVLVIWMGIGRHEGRNPFGLHQQSTDRGRRGSSTSSEKVVEELLVSINPVQHSIVPRGWNPLAVASLLVDGPLRRLAVLPRAPMVPASRKTRKPWTDIRPAMISSIHGAVDDSDDDGDDDPSSSRSSSWMMAVSVSTQHFSSSACPLENCGWLVPDDGVDGTRSLSLEQDCRSTWRRPCRWNETGNLLRSCSLDDMMRVTGSDSSHNQ